MHLDQHQEMAIKNAALSRFAIITGGAGTGKTTIIKQLTDLLESRGETVRLCAFAGKAASRLREACGHPASTIHKLLESNSIRFCAESFEGQSIIIDESSMVSSEIMAEITRRTPDRLILVGDPAQVKPVGRGQPFHDLINLFPEHVNTLKTCYRATEAVLKAATAIRAGIRPLVKDVSTGERWNLVSTGGDLSTHKKIMKAVEKGNIDFATDIILCPRNGKTSADYATCKGLNYAIVSAIGLPRSNERDLQSGDRVINTQNLPDKDVWNGSTGTVHAVDIDGGVWVSMDVPVIDKDRSNKDIIYYTDKVIFSAKQKKKLEYAYALTVHKAQGSQYRRVIFVVLNRDSWSLLDRSLIYTAVTRTQQQCMVVGELSAFYAGIEKVEHKKTVLQEIV